MTVEVLGKDSKRVALFLSVCMLLALAPATNVSAEDIGDPANLQAQDIQASFDSLSETTTVTWRNIDIDSSVLQGLFSATYNVYRSDVPITSLSITSMTPFETGIPACLPGDVLNDAFKCRGLNGTVAPFSVSFIVSPGVNNSFYYAVTTTTGDGSELFDLDLNASVLYEPVLEVTTPVRSPYNLIGSFDPDQSATTLQWVNYNDINPVLPETGENAYSIHVYQTTYQATRQNGASLLEDETPIAVLEAGNSSHTVAIPPSTDRNMFYSITYVLPNWIAPGQDYEDVRFLSNNAMSTGILEDNMPPSQVPVMSAQFIATPSNGRGVTNLTWDDVMGENGESYRIYMSSGPFSSILSPNVQLVATVAEGVESFSYSIPTGRLGYAYYCIVTVDVYGAYDANTSFTSCSGAVEEDSFSPWIAEPTNVYAEFIGDRTTRITWVDQLGVQGERYHVWSSTWRVTGAEFIENQSVQWLGVVSDGVGEFNVALPEGLPDTTRTHYFVTTEALYGHLDVTYMDTRLNQNHFQIAEGNEEDTTAPNPARVKEANPVGSLNYIELEWFNEDDIDERYQVWRHYGQPFGEDFDEIGTIEDEGWELAIDQIEAGSSAASTLYRQIPIPDDVDRDVWYAVIIEDKWGNSNPEAYSGLGANAVMVNEDTRSPNASLMILNDDNEVYSSPSLVSGDYKLWIEFDEYLGQNPLLTIHTNGGENLFTDREMVLMQENAGDPDRGPIYQLDFFITTQTSPGPLMFNLSMSDLAENTATMFWEDRAVDAVLPSVTIYSPSSSNDGNSKYLYGNNIQILAGASDDVRIDSFQYKFTYNYGSNQAVSTPWTDSSSTSDLNGDNSSLVMDLEFSAGNFLPGQHAVYVRALDSAGNERSVNVIFVVDDCINRLDGTTMCNYVESLKDAPEPIEITPSFTDPPYVLVWVLSGVFFLSLLIMLFVIQTSMSGPKKKKARGEEEDDDDWMSEFIGTSQDMDMDAVTDTSKPDEKSMKSEPDQPVEEDPFAVNTVTRKTRRKKDEAEEAAVDDDDDDGVDWSEYDDDDEDEEVVEKPVTKKRSVGRRAAPRKAPKRRAVSRKKDDE
ncbi:MAG: hypothetical protein CMA63_05045 [Euryarchaeota archaeon]|nr:hypothetical protein [Euryarchaeota archaeon]|tara:strand:- start:21949 stop:25188 length:3240 start_codon:yes stop_codon:yes gene_type:complete